MKWNEVVAGLMAIIMGLAIWAFLCLVESPYVPESHYNSNLVAMFLGAGIREVLFPTFFFLWISVAFVMLGLIIFFGDKKANEIDSREEQFARDKVLIISCTCLPMYYLFVYMMGLYRFGVGVV